MLITWFGFEITNIDSLILYSLDLKCLQDGDDPPNLDLKNVEASMAQKRRRVLEAFADGSDHDLRQGRFGRFKTDMAPPLKDRGTSSTRASQHSSGLSRGDESRVKNEEDLKEFLDMELKTYFANESDANLFVKILIADGIVSRLQQMQDWFGSWGIGI